MSALELLQESRLSYCFNPELFLDCSLLKIDENYAKTTTFNFVAGSILLGLINVMGMAANEEHMLLYLKNVDVLNMVAFLPRVLIIVVF